MSYLIKQFKSIGEIQMADKLVNQAFFSTQLCHLNPLLPFSRTHDGPFLANIPFLSVTLIFLKSALDITASETISKHLSTGDMESQ